MSVSRPDCRSTTLYPSSVPPRIPSPLPLSPPLSLSQEDVEAAVDEIEEAKEAAEEAKEAEESKLEESKDGGAEETKA